MPEDRKVARFFQGAKVSVGAVTALGRPASEMTDDEVAYICARYMSEQAEPVPGVTDGLLYHPGLPTVLQNLFPYEDVDAKRQIAIRRRLRSNGFVAVVDPREGFRGYLVPKSWTWSDAPVAVTPKIQEAPETPVSPVATRWSCRGCPRTFDTQGARDAHERDVHEHKEEQVTEAQQVPDGSDLPSAWEHGKPMEVDRTPRKDLPTINTHEQKLLAAVQAEPGLAPREYIRRIEQPVALPPLKQLGLVRVEGHTRKARLYPATEVPASAFPTREPAHFGHATRDEALREVKAHPGLTAREIAEKIGRHPTSVMAALTELAAMKKVRAHGNVNRTYIPYRGGTTRKTEPQVTTASPTVVPEGYTVGDASGVLQRLAAIVGESKRLREENERLKVELDAYAKVKELLGL